MRERDATAAGSVRGAGVRDGLGGAGRGWLEPQPASRSTAAIHPRRPIDAQSTRFAGVAVPTEADVRRIGAIESPALRNLEITYCYSRLAAAMEERTGAGANWCAFATWASRQAGRTIRGEDLEAQVALRLNPGKDLLHPFVSLWRWLLRRGLFDPGSKLGRLTKLLHTPFDAFELASDAVGRGNKKVFDEIGLEFARYLHAVPADAAPDSPAMEAFLAGLRAGEPPDGQDYLRRAFLRYQQPSSAQAILLANLEIGMHEQTRLQPEIRAALDAPYATARPIIGPQKLASKIAREAITAYLMLLSMPGRVLALGHNLSDPFPEDLRVPADPELIALLAGFEPVSPAVDDCGAEDWSDFGQRMHYIAHLFRVFHANGTLYDAPFAPAQVQRILAGAIPDGDL